MFRRRKATNAGENDAEEVDAEIREKKKWSRRPANTAFKQQRLKAWQPILTPKTVGGSHREHWIRAQWWSLI